MVVIIATTVVKTVEDSLQPGEREDERQTKPDDKHDEIHQEVAMSNQGVIEMLQEAAPEVVGRTQANGSSERGQTHAWIKKIKKGGHGDEGSWQCCKMRLAGSSWKKGGRARGKRMRRCRKQDLELFPLL
jgi:hypothetical protein